MTALLAHARSLLSDVFGFSAFRPGQQEIIEAVLAGQDVLAIMPTGAGKSLCYQLPALTRPGLTVVVSPLIALMRDQVAALRSNGIEAASLNSANEAAENRETVARLRSGQLKLLYAAPERLLRPETQALLAQASINTLAIDEAHCVSQWGHDFRPEYLAIGELRRALSDVQTIAFTATADAATRADIVGRLFANTPRIFVGGFDRPNLRLAMQAKASPKRQILDFVSRRRGSSGVIYCASRARTEELAGMLAAEGFHALPYHAGLDKHDRERNQDVFLREDAVVMCATIAFGMGIDKPDVRFVCHADLPRNIESYYQEIGRAGRDGLAADTLTLYGLGDVRLRRIQIEESQAPDEQKRVEHQRLGALLALCEAPRCRRQTLLAYFGEESLPCGNCDLCSDGAQGFDGTVLAQKALSAVVRTGQCFGTEHLVNILCGIETDAVRQRGHHKLPTFGVGADRKRDEWRSIFRQLYAAGLLWMDLGEHGGWSITEAGYHVLKGRDSVRLRADPLRPRASRRRGDSQTDTGNADPQLLARLKGLRTAIATREGVPAYVIFPDRTLIELATEKPATLDEMRAIHGIGQAKLDRFGEAFLSIILDQE